MGGPAVGLWRGRIVVLWRCRVGKETELRTREFDGASRTWGEAVVVARGAEDAFRRRAIVTIANEVLALLWEAADGHSSALLARISEDSIQSAEEILTIVKASNLEREQSQILRVHMNDGVTTFGFLQRLDESYFAWLVNLR